MPNFNRVYVYYGLVIFFLGIFNLSITPVFEGFDENAHYSSIREIGYSDKLSLTGRSFLDKSIEDYDGPKPYSSGNPPYESARTYKNFFSNYSLQSTYEKKYRQDAFLSDYHSGVTLNWESQHPPLYYLLLAPALKAFSNHSLVVQIFVLRFISYSLALLGIFFGILAVLKRATLAIDSADDSIAMIFGFLLYPFLLPMFFPEFSRIGNDSLCLFFIGLLSYNLSKANLEKLNRFDSLLMGCILGLGLLTKAFFIPIGGAVLLYFLFNIHQKIKEGDYGLLVNTLVIYGVAIIIGSSWYLYNYFTSGNLIGSNVAQQLNSQGGFLTNISNNFSLTAFIRGVATTLVTFIWGGTWSLVHLQHYLYLPMVGLLVWIIFIYCRSIKSDHISSIRWLPIWLIVLFEVGFLWHVLLNIALGQDGNANTPGWYLHILLPFLAPAIGLALFKMLRKPRYKFIFIILLIYSLFFYLIANWFQISLFTGCSVKGSDKVYLFDSNNLCFDRIPQLYDNLALLAYPNLAAISLLFSMVFGMLLLFELKKHRHSI